ncbi:hypothetical protein VE03_07049 [Pseudogymnoascus sp. 23342-1-I1]|nr:hypothetical protein VE03_07049 [Pseudogymnoascus sp. 23342-1-I1]
MPQLTQAQSSNQEDAVKDTPTYLSIDIDGSFRPWATELGISLLDVVLGLSIVPAIGTPESGGWTACELKRYIKGLEGINLVGADVIEVGPPYDSTVETTSVAAADLIVDILAAMAKSKKGLTPFGNGDEL